jgi:ATP-dependent Clp protease ATP-binding subunit ClpC
MVPRPLKRAIQNYVEDLIAEEIVKSNIKEGNKFKIDCNKNNTELNIIKI